MKTWIYIDGTFKDAHAEIELLRGYRDAAEADAAVARLLLDKSRLTETEMDAMQTAIDTLHAVQDQTKDPCAKTAIAAARLMRLRDRLKPIGNVDSDRPQPIGSPAKTNPTQPRNGTPVEGSVPGEGSVPDSRSENEPVAWAVEKKGYPPMFAVFNDWNFACRAAMEEYAEIVPLYRHPPCQDLLQKNFTVCPHVRGTVTQHCSLNFTLTDAEREAVEQAIDAASGMAQAEPWAVATLRKLLERLA